MRTSVFVGVSLDGFIARPTGAFDYLAGGEPVSGDHNGCQAFFSTVDAVLMGRNTYDVVVPFPTWPYGQTPVFVLSNRALQPAPAGAVVEHHRGTAEEVLTRLATRGVQHVYVDGGRTVQAFLRAGLIRHLTITRVPVLIGEGIPLFGPLDADIRLRHVATRHLGGGAVQSEYAID